MKNNFFKPYIPHIIAFFAFLFLLTIYFYPVLKGKILLQNVIVQIIGSLKESTDWQKKTGEEVLWSGSTFSGMPVWRGHGTNVLGQVHTFLAKTLPVPIHIGLIGFIGFYILLSAFRIHPWLRITGSLAFVFSSFNFISLEAGHINKVFAMALMAPVLGGIYMIYNGRRLSGAVVTTVFLSLQLIR